MSDQPVRCLFLLFVALTVGGCNVVVDDPGPGPGPGPGPVLPDPEPDPFDPGDPVDPGDPGDPVDPVDDREITCANFADFVDECTPECTVIWDCELAYDSLSVDDQIALDACSDCLVDNLDAGFCADCSVPEEGIDSCELFLEDLLGVDCW